MLIYPTPWLAGVVFPTLIIVGLMAIPYIDKNPKGSGYYSFKQRRVEITLFLFRFLLSSGALPALLAPRKPLLAIPVGQGRSVTVIPGLRNYYERLGPVRYSVFVLLLLSMMALPIKMVLRRL